MTGGPREQRLVFGEVGDIYDRVRPGYPGKLFSRLFERTGPVALAVEVGAGTGRATRELAPRCDRLVALEPSPGMASVLRRRCGALASVEVVESGFEAWPAAAASAGAVDLIAAAQAWHWVDTVTGPAQAARLLRPGGVIALIWNRPLLSGLEIQARLDVVYQQEAPELTSARPWESRASGPEDLQQTGEFETGELQEFSHELTWSTADYLDLMRTQSDHRLLPEAQRERLLAAIEVVIDDHGGRITVPYTALLHTAVRR